MVRGVLRAANTTPDTSLFGLVVRWDYRRLHAASQTQICDLLGGGSGS